MEADGSLSLCDSITWAESANLLFTIYTSHILEKIVYFSHMLSFIYENLGYLKVVFSLKAIVNVFICSFTF